jgi:hypothetical protein
MVWKRVKLKAHVLYAPLTDNPRSKSLSALHMIGNVVSVLVTIVIPLFNYILTSVRALQKKFMFARVFLQKLIKQ